MLVPRTLLPPRTLQPINPNYLDIGGKLRCNVRSSWEREEILYRRLTKVTLGCQTDKTQGRSHESLQTLPVRALF
jgi:hypothetical protein